MNKEQIIIVCLSILVSIALIVAIIYFFIVPLFKKKFMYKNFKYVYYKKVYKVAEYNDYLLINQINLKDNDDIIVSKIDHIILGKKFIYIIKDRYYRGALNGEKLDNTWLFFDEKNNKKEVSNPMLKNEERVKKFSAISNIDPSFCISIVLINDDCVVKNPNELNSNNSFIISCKKLNKLIKTIEKRKVKDIDQKSAEIAMNDLYRIYGRGQEE